MCDPVAAKIWDLIVSKLDTCSSFLSASDAQKIIGDNNHYTGDLGKLILNVNVDCAVKSLNSNQFWIDLSDALYDVVSVTPGLNLAGGASREANRAQATSQLSTLLDKDHIQTCVLRFNAGQSLMGRRGSFENLIRPTQVQLREIARCLIDPVGLSTLYHSSSTGTVTPLVPGRRPVGPLKSKDDSSSTWIIWLIVILIILALLFWFWSKNRKTKVVEYI